MNYTSKSVLIWHGITPYFLFVYVCVYIFVWLCTSGVNFPSSHQLYHGLVSVSLTHEQLVSHALRHRPPLAPPLRNHGSKVGRLKCQAKGCGYKSRGWFPLMALMCSVSIASKNTIRGSRPARLLQPRRVATRSSFITRQPSAFATTPT